MSFPLNQPAQHYRSDTSHKVFNTPVGIRLTEGSTGAEDQVAGDPFIMTYNLNHGFSEDGRLALESMARIVESATPDIVALQEVSRGWVATGGVDMVAWLEHRLGIPIIFAPTADPQWGIAIATGLQTSVPAVVSLGAAEHGLARAALDVSVQVSAEFELRVIVAQLDQVEADVEPRGGQVRALLNVWGGSANTVVMGDFGSAPSRRGHASTVRGRIAEPGASRRRGSCNYSRLGPHHPARLHLEIAGSRGVGRSRRPAGRQRPSGVPGSSRRGWCRRLIGARHMRYSP